jgi:hypothetical protein
MLLVAENVDGFRVNNGYLRPLEKARLWTFTFSHARRTDAFDCWKICASAFPKLRSMSYWRQRAFMRASPSNSDCGAETGHRENRSLTSNLTLSVARGADIEKGRSATNICGLWMKVETYRALKSPLHCQRCQHTRLCSQVCGLQDRSPPGSVLCSSAGPNGLKYYNV